MKRFLAGPAVEHMRKQGVWFCTVAEPRDSHRPAFALWEQRIFDAMSGLTGRYGQQFQEAPHPNRELAVEWISLRQVSVHIAPDRNLVGDREINLPRLTIMRVRRKDGIGQGPAAWFRFQARQFQRLAR